MALKYWYVASNGSAAWSVAGNWYNGSGGTGGVAGVPTTADDAIVNAASGSGTLTIGGTSTCNSLNTLTFTGTLAGTFALNIVTSSIASNSGFVLQLGGNHTYSGTITFTTTIPATTATLYINCNDIFHKGNMTFNTATAYWEGWDTINYEPIRLTGTFLLTSGSIFSNALYTGIISTSNSNVRTFAFGDVYLSGTGTLIVATTQTNLTWDVTFGIYLTNTTTTAKTITFSSVVYSFGGLYIQGSGVSTTTVAVAATTLVYPDIYVSKTGGTLIFNTTYLTNLTFIEGTTVSWGGTSSIFIYGNVTMCNSVINGATNPLNFVKAGAQTFTTFNKTFAGALLINDGGSFSNNTEIVGDYNSTYTGTGINITSTSFVEFTGSVFLNNASILINGGAGGPQIYFKAITLAITLTISNSYVYLGSSASSSTFATSLVLNTGYLSINANSTINTPVFTSSSNTSVREVNLGTNTIINITGSTGTIWNTSTGISTGVLTFNPGTSTMNITDATGGTVNFLGGGINLYDLNVRRGVLVANNPTTTFSGNQTYRNFRDLTTLQSGFINTIQFASSSNTSIIDTFQVGNSGNVTDIVSSAPTTYFNLIKVNAGLVICPNVAIRYSAASPSNTWYAISGSVNNVTTGWIFDNLPRRLGSLGAG